MTYGCLGTRGCVCVCVYLTSVRKHVIKSRVLKAPEGQRTPGGLSRPGVFLAKLDTFGSSKQKPLRETKRGDCGRVYMITKSSDLAPRGKIVFCQLQRSPFL
jgi:hypothetical protein